MVSSFPHRRSCAAFPARSGPPVSHNRLILSLFPALGKGFFPIGPAAFWAEQEISSRRLAFSPAILYNDWDFKGNARDHAADHQRARPRLKARKAGKPARGPAANPRRAVPVTERSSRALSKAPSKVVPRSIPSSLQRTEGFLGANLQVCDAGHANSKGHK